MPSAAAIKRGHPQAAVRHIVHTKDCFECVFKSKAGQQQQSEERRPWWWVVASSAFSASARKLEGSTLVVCFGAVGTNVPCSAMMAVVVESHVAGCVWIWFFSFLLTFYHFHLPDLAIHQVQSYWAWHASLPLNHNHSLAPVCLHNSSTNTYVAFCKEGCLLPLCAHC